MKFFVRCFALSACEEKVANWSYSSSMKNDRSTLLYRCLDGFTHTRPNVDRITCVYNDDHAEWVGEFEDCVLNYCPLDDLNQNVTNVYAEVTGYGNAPNISSINILIEQIPSLQRKVGIFFDNAVIHYRCSDGFSSEESLQFTRTCKMFPTESGYGRWEPASQSCTRMLYYILLRNDAIFIF